MKRQIIPFSFPKTCCTRFCHFWLINHDVQPCSCVTKEGIPLSGTWNKQKEQRQKRNTLPTLWCSMSSLSWWDVTPVQMYTATNNNIGWGWIELTLCSSWKLPCMPIVYNPVLVPRCCPVFCCMKVIRLFGPPSLIQDNYCTMGTDFPNSLIFG